MDGMTTSDETPTDGSGSAADLRAELGRVESELSLMHQEVRELRTQLRDEGPVDAADRSAIITQAEELESFVEQLERRRRTLLEKLGEAS